MHFGNEGFFRFQHFLKGDVLFHHHRLIEDDIGGHDGHAVQQDAVVLLGTLRQNGAETAVLFQRIPMGGAAFPVLFDAVFHFLIDGLRRSDIEDVLPFFTDQILGEAAFAAARAAGNQRNMAHSSSSSRMSTNSLLSMVASPKVAIWLIMANA